MLSLSGSVCGLSGVVMSSAPCRWSIPVEAPLLTRWRSLRCSLHLHLRSLDVDGAAAGELQLDGLAGAAAHGVAPADRRGDVDVDLAHVRHVGLRVDGDGPGAPDREGDGPAVADHGRGAVAV